MYRYIDHEYRYLNDKLLKAIINLWTNTNVVEETRSNDGARHVGCFERPSNRESPNFEVEVLLLGRGGVWWASEAWWWTDMCRGV